MDACVLKYICCYLPKSSIYMFATAVTASEIQLLIVKPPAVDEVTKDTHLPLFLQVWKKITFDHDG